MDEWIHEQVSRGIRLICCLAAPLKFISSYPLLWLSMELASILIVIFHLQSTLLSTQNYLILSCQCATSPKFVAITGFKLELSIYLWKRFLFNLVDTIFRLVDMELSCGLWVLFYSSWTSAECWKHVDTKYTELDSRGCEWPGYGNILWIGAL